MGLWFYVSQPLDNEGDFEPHYCVPANLFGSTGWRSFVGIVGQEPAKAGTISVNLVVNAKTGKPFLAHQHVRRQDGGLTFSEPLDDPKNYPIGYKGTLNACVKCHSVNDPSHRPPRSNLGNNSFGK
jgi:hypothetical protein